MRGKQGHKWLPKTERIKGRRRIKSTDLWYCQPLAYVHQDFYDEVSIRTTLELAASLHMCLGTDNLQAASVQPTICPSKCTEQCDFLLFFFFLLWTRNSIVKWSSALLLETEIIANQGPALALEIHKLASIFISKVIIFSIFGGATMRQHLHCWVLLCPRQSAPAEAIIPASPSAIIM